jgi:NADPH-dependent glutamate synthase beta subunit-like oxidoreductase
MACVEVCPTGALMDKSVRPGKKDEDLVPCKAACPVHMDAPWYLRLIAEGKTDEANAVIGEKVPLPGILGRVCTHPCEAVCRRREVNEAISICALKRYAADRGKGHEKKAAPRDDTGQRAAIIGSGPAGLTAAFYLRKKGHRVTVFEARSKPGGMMRYGIPRYRLPEELLDREIKEIFDLGIEFRPNHALGKEITLERLRLSGYGTVFLAVGAQRSRRVSLEGADARDVLWGLEFLCRVAEGEKLRLKERVLVIGGGNVAVDAALTAKRCGAKEVTLVCLEKRQEMPAHLWEVEGALAEGVKIVSSSGPRRILTERGQVTGIEIAHCTSVFDDRGLLDPSFDDPKAILRGDQVILALGQEPDLSFIEGSAEIRTASGLITVNPGTLETGMKGVYAGGDVTAAPGSVVHAIAAGRKAAAAMDKALGGNGDIDEVLVKRGVPGPKLGHHAGFASRPREKVPELDPPSRQENFREVSLGFSEGQALKEAGRCLQCDLRLFMAGNPSPPKRWLAFDEENVRKVPEAEGVLQLYDGGHKVLWIKGTADLREELVRLISAKSPAVWFAFEENTMYSKRESELIQKYLQEHGRMPAGGLEDEDLF